MKSSKFANLKVLGCVAVIATILGPLPVVAAPDFKSAVADYNAGKYGQAATEFESLKAAYPNNALTRYYLGLSRQALGHFEKAKQEYQWVSANGDARLRTMAAQGMQRLSGAKTSVTQVPAPITQSQNNSTARVATSNSPAAKVTKILKFTAPWCGPCQNFAPIFQSVQSDFRGITFEEIDFDTNPELKAKFNVSSIPHLVFLDATGKVLLSRSGAPRSADSFARMIKMYQ